MFSVREEVCKIVVKKITTEELIREGAYKSANKELTNENFPFRVFQNSFSGEKRIRFIETHEDCYMEDILFFAKDQRFERPTYEVALLFGAQNGKRNRALCFLHKPWDEKNIVIKEEDKNKYIDLYYIYSRTIKKGSFIFPFIEEG